MFDDRYPDHDDVRPWPDDFIQGFDWLDFQREVNKETMRGKVLMTAHFLETLLALALRGFLIQGAATDKLLDGFNAPLGTFSAKITACAALGVITESECASLDALRDVRNAFAHAVTPDLERGKAKSGLDRLKAIYGLQSDSQPDFVVDFCILRIIPQFLNRGEHAEVRRLKEQEWDISRPTASALAAARA